MRRTSHLGLSGEPPSAWLGALTTFAAVAVGTAVVYPLKSVAPAVSLGIVYIPGVLLVATIWGLRLGLATALSAPSPSTGSTSRRWTTCPLPTAAISSPCSSSRSSR